MAGLDYLTLSYSVPDPSPVGQRYLIESTADLVRWTETDVAVLSVVHGPTTRTTTVRDRAPLGASETRFLRVRVIPAALGASQ